MSLVAIIYINILLLILCKNLLPIGLGSTRSVPTLTSMPLPINSAVPALADLAHIWQQPGTDVHVAAVWGFASASTGRLGTLLVAIWCWCECSCCLSFCQCQHWQTWHTFGSNLVLMCMSLLSEFLPVPVLEDLAHFWQQFGTDVYIQPQRLWRLLIVIQ